VWEKMEEKLKEIGASKGSLMQSISGWAKGLGAAKVAAKAKQEAPPLCYSFANFLILSRIKAALGLDKCKGFLYGAAPIKQSTVDYFASLDITIGGAYGMSETTAAVSISNNDKFNLKSVGTVYEGIDLKIDNPDEKGHGEIIFRGRNMMMGYLKNEAATRETIDNQGYLHSGDLGTVDKDNFLFITGRIKELIITAGGENVAPLIIEDNFKEYCPPCSNIMVMGENQKFLCAFVTFKVDVDMAKGIPSHNLTSDARTFFKNNLNVEVKTSDEAIANEKIQKFIEQCFEKTNKKAVSRAAYVRKWKLLPTDFSIHGNELTPTLKLKRKVTEKKY
jgi:long-chain-fatty-acid--CoA ligase ACSBG